jgi:hypothetical protein
MPDSLISNSLQTGLLTWAEALGAALGQGVARGINAGLSPLASGVGSGGLVAGPRKRGRPAAVFTGVVPEDRRCKFPGCNKPMRSKGLCSAHYQAARRKKLARA